VTPNIPPFNPKPADTLLFWDGIHPTKVGHAILARETADVLQ
jgi:phospholipase/lecithinase/hemolysin